LLYVIRWARPQIQAVAVAKTKGREICLIGFARKSDWVGI